MTFEKLKAKWQRDIDLNRHRANAVMACLTNECVDIYKNYTIEKVILFGSILSNHFNKQSDIDIYVEPLDSQKHWAFQHDIEEVLNLSIDLHTNSDEPSFIEKILARGKIIYEA